MQQHQQTESAEYDDHVSRSFIPPPYSHSWAPDEQNQSDNDNMRDLNVPSPNAHMSHTPQSPDMHHSPSPYSPPLRYPSDSVNYYNQSPPAHDHNPQDPYNDRRILETAPANEVETEDENEADPQKQHHHEGQVEDDNELAEEAEVEEDGDETQSESDEQQREPTDGGATEEESNPSPPPAPPPLPKSQEQSSFSRRKPRAQPPPKPKRFSWSNYHPIVYHASEYCKQYKSVPALMAYARILGAGKGTIDYFVRSRTIYIGRWGYGADCQIKSDSRNVSRKHAKLFWDSALDNWMLECLSVKNGMVVDGAPIAPLSTPVPLRSKSLIEMGDIAFYFLTATKNTLCVNDLELLDQVIDEARTAQEIEMTYVMNGGDVHPDDDEVRPEIKTSSRGDRYSSKRGGAEARRSRDAGRRGSKGLPNAVGTHTMEPDVTSSDSSASEVEQQAVPDILDDPKYRLSYSSGSKRGGEKGGRKRRRKKDRTYDHSKYEALNYTDDWNKKEKTDFTRALFAVGVDALYDNQGNITGFDWTRFRGIAEFPKKSDEMLEEHYRHLMSDVHALLDGDVRDKKARKSGKRKREDDDPDSDADGDEKRPERLIGLVTAQKLRVRIGILESSKRVDEKIWDFAMIKLESTLQSSLKEFPEWWVRGTHDRDLMRGVAIHGIGTWNLIWEDDTLESFVAEIEGHNLQGEEVIWPSNQAVMKRVREIGTAMMFEIKRLAKRDADEERRQRKRARKKEKRLKKIGGQGLQHRDDGKDRHREDTENRRDDSRSPYDYRADESQERNVYMQPGTYENGESTADDSASENRNEPTPAEEVETEDEEEEVLDEGRAQDDDDVNVRHDGNGVYERQEDMEMRDDMEHDDRHPYERDRYEEPVRHDRNDWRYSEEDNDRGYPTASESE